MIGVFFILLILNIIAPEGEKFAQLEGRIVSLKRLKNQDTRQTSMLCSHGKKIWPRVGNHRKDSGSQNRPKDQKKFVTTIKTVYIKPVYIKPDNTSLKTKRTVQAKIDVKRINVAIKGVKPIKNGGIIVDTISEEDLDKLIYEFKAKDELTKEFQIEKPATRNPHIICFGRVSRHKGRSTHGKPEKSIPRRKRGN
ncbi:hypothetical protein CEXT_736571 [Caerostris extrusa]|uniref:Uncharacterized protein n=1 Tax=Caerostris extrusa TaxID=172846 RepID=A0AAV4V1D3_CAEEX|nr:hypothetical protein CEXT_736571 [Caerostris extrusa]